MMYRKEIDGLRAIAVLSVILFHAHIHYFDGGYVGVDIFFVISGYLITSNIVREQEICQFSIVNFYERRARRILPALTIVLLVTTIAAFILMPADLLKAYSASLIPVVAFYSNIFFHSTIDYFATASNEQPLLHTWSLAVEEQYYIFFPILVILIWNFGKKQLALIIATLSVVSMLYSQYLITQNSPDTNFYLTPSRSWELFFGSMTTLFSPYIEHKKPWKKELVSVIGLLMIVYSVLFFDNQTPSPSFYTLIPIFGTCTIIVYANNTTVVGRLLSSKLLVFIGILSYSLYLWHQPVFAFLHIKTVGKPTSSAFVMSIGVIFVASYLSWKYIETPFRNKRVISRPYIFLYSIMSILTFVTVGMLGKMYDGFEFRFKNSVYADSVKYSPKRIECHTYGKIT